MRKSLLRLALAMLILFAAACSRVDDTPNDSAQPGEGTDSSSQDPIIIGHVLGETGWMNFYDVPNHNFAQLAADKINAEGGVLGRQLEIVTFDMKTDPPLGATGVEDVLEQGASVILVPGDYDTAVPAITTANGQGIPTISPSAGDPHVGEVGPFSFGTGLTTNVQGATMAEWGYGEKGWRTAFVLTDQSIGYSKTLGQYFTEAWETIGGEVVGEDTFINDDPSIAGQITRMKNGPEPDVIFLASYLPGAASATKQIRAAGLDMPILSGVGSGDGLEWFKAIPNLTDFYYSAYAFVYGEGDPNPEIPQVQAEYEEKYGAKLDGSHGYTGYVAVQIFADAIERAGSTDGAAIQAALESTNVETILGTVVYTSDQHMRFNPSVRINGIIDGKQTFVKLWDVQNPPAP